MKSNFLAVAVVGLVTFGGVDSAKANVTITTGEPVTTAIILGATAVKAVEVACTDDKSKSCTEEAKKAGQNAIDYARMKKNPAKAAERAAKRLGKETERGAKKVARGVKKTGKEVNRAVKKIFGW